MKQNNLRFSRHNQRRSHPSISLSPDSTDYQPQCDRLARSLLNPYVSLGRMMCPPSLRLNDTGSRGFQRLYGPRFPGNMAPHLRINPMRTFLIRAPYPWYLGTHTLYTGLKVLLGLFNHLIVLVVVCQFCFRLRDFKNALSSDYALALLQRAQPDFETTYHNFSTC